MKTCYTCKQNKTLDCYHKNKAKADGFEINCKECRVSRSKKYYETSKTKIPLPDGMKRCNDCNEVKAVSEFNRRGEKSYRHHCRDCQKLANKQEAILFADRIRKSRQAHYKIHRNRIIARCCKYNTNKYKNDMMYRLKQHIRGRVNKLIQLKRFNKNNNFAKYLGCDLEYFKNYIESKFKPGMTWDNYGVGGWVLDHVIPISSAETVEMLYDLNHYSNLQPLWELENRIKSDKIIK